MYMFSLFQLFLLTSPLSRLLPQLFILIPHSALVSLLKLMSIIYLTCWHLCILLIRKKAFLYFEFGCVQQVCGGVCVCTHAYTPESPSPSRNTCKILRKSQRQIMKTFSLKYFNLLSVLSRWSCFVKLHIDSLVLKIYAHRKRYYNLKISCKKNNWIKAGLKFLTDR